jgi:nitrogen fixation protein FixH
MDGQNLLLTLGVGVSTSFILFFIFRGLRQPAKLAALLTILVVEGIYIPWSALHWKGLDVFAIHFAFYTMVPAGLGIIFGNQDNNPPVSGGKTKSRLFHWVPLTIIAFFLILATVDSVIITLANQGASADFVRKFLPVPKGKEVGKNVASAFSGTVANNFQKDVAQYNRYVDELRQQAALGWRIMDGWVDKPVAGKASLFRLRVIDDEGMPVSGAKVVVQFMFSADKKQDSEVTLPEVEPGFYGQPVTLPESGAWSLLIDVKRGKDAYEAKGETLVAVSG